MISVFLATPAYNGQVVPQFEESLKGSLRVLKDAGIPAHWEVLSGCCYLPIARNKLVKKFLESDATDLVFIDADIEWTSDDLLRLLEWPVDIVGAPYRHKTWEETYPVWLRTDEKQRPVMAGLSELVGCWILPTGFLRITRSAFSAIQKHYGEELEVDEYTTEAKLTGGYLNFFDTGKIGRQWWGEDTNFCRKWTMEMGRPLWVDPGIVLTHWGKSTFGDDEPFRGDYSDYMSRFPGGANDPGYYGAKIDGYLTLREAQWLYQTSKKMTSVVEIGSFLGKSAHALLSGCNGPVTCIDSWGILPWIENDSQETADARFNQFLDNTKEFPFRIVKRTSSMDAVKCYPDKSVDMVWIDGDHARKSVVDDVTAWLSKARKMICGHDYNFWGWPEVKEEIDKMFGDKVKTEGTIWYVELDQ